MGKLFPVEALSSRLNPPGGPLPLDFHYLANIPGAWRESPFEEERDWDHFPDPLLPRQESLKRE